MTNIDPITTIDRAAHIIDTWIQDHTLTPDTGNTHYLASALADAGALAHELPEPEPADDGALTWAAGNVWVEDDEDIVYTEFPRRWSMLSPHGARELGLALLAAAQHTKRQA